MKNLMATLDRRMRRNRGKWPCLRWQAALFLSGNLVLILALLYDSHFGENARDLPKEIRFFGRNLTDLGKSGWVLFISAFLLFEGLALARLLRSPTERGRAMFMSAVGAYVLISIAASGLLANLLKRLIGRARPEKFDQLGAFGFHPLAGDAGFESFPSGHSTTIGAFFVALALLCPRWSPIFLAGGLWLGMTRLMVGAHYPSDIIAGLAFGGWFSFFMAIVFSRYGLVFATSDNGWPTPRHPALRT